MSYPCASCYFCLSCPCFFWPNPHDTWSTVCPSQPVLHHNRLSGLFIVTCARPYQQCPPITNQPFTPNDSQLQLFPVFGALIVLCVPFLTSLAFVSRVAGLAPAGSSIANDDAGSSVLTPKISTRIPLTYTGGETWKATHAKWEQHRGITKAARRVVGFGSSRLIRKNNTKKNSFEQSKFRFREADVTWEIYMWFPWLWINQDFGLSILGLSGRYLREVPEVPI